MDGLHRVGQGQVNAAESLVLDQGEHEGGGPHLQEGRHLGQVGVAHDDVETAVALGIGVGLVAGVHDGPLQRGLEADLLLEELRALRELEGDVRARAAGVSLPTLPAPVKIWRVTKCGVIRWAIRAKGTARSMR